MSLSLVKHSSLLTLIVSGRQNKYLPWPPIIHSLSLIEVSLCFERKKMTVKDLERGQYVSVGLCMVHFLLDLGTAAGTYRPNLCVKSQCTKVYLTSTHINMLYDCLKFEWNKPT